MDTKWLTFIVPAYNAGETLKKTIDSILFQTQKGSSVIIIDDGSTDGETARLGKYYAQCYPKDIIYIYEKNQGQGHARNEALKLVTTPYVAFLDSDDWLMPDFVEKLMPLADVDMIFTLPKIYDESTGIVSDWYDKRLFEELFDKDGKELTLEQDIRLLNLEVSMCRRIFRMEFFRNCSFQFPEGVKWEDVFAHFYVMSKCKSCKGIGSTGFYYRVGTTTQTTGQGGKDRLDIIPVFCKVLDYVEAEGRHDMIYPVMRCLLRFSISSIRRSNVDVRRVLVVKLNNLYHSIPKQYFRIFYKEAAKYHTKTDRLQYRFFVMVIRLSCLNWICNDYLVQDIGEQVVRKILRAKGKVQ